MHTHLFLFCCVTQNPFDFQILSQPFLFLHAFISPGQARDGSGALGLGEPQLRADPPGPGGAACKPHQPDRLPLPPEALHRGGPWGEAGIGSW